MTPPSPVLSPPLPPPPATASYHNQNCPPGASGRYPHPFDCTKFLMCSNGEAHVQDCGPGTAWNKAMEVCDFKDKVDCNQSNLSGTISTSIINTQCKFN